jgi:spermidine/putrescine transport system ATP-binding protein
VTAHPVPGPAATAAADVAVRFEGVTKRFDGVTAVDALDLAVTDGEFLALLGPSGCGKTTCLRMVAGFEDPDEGRVLVAGHDVTGMPPARRPVNTVFQTYALFGHLDVERNVAFGLRRHGIAAAERRRRVGEALDMVRMGHLRHRRPRELSGGQQQRVALARALVLRPRVLLLDEPLSALDLQLRKEMQLELKALHREVGCTFLFVTHDQGEAMSMADRVAVMSHGRIVQIDRPAVVYDRPATPFVASFIGEMTTFAGRATGGVVTIGDTRLPAPGVPEGPVTVGVRPESVTVARPGAADGKGYARVTCRLAAVDVLGDHVRVVLDAPGTSGGAPLVARRPREDGDTLARLRPGDEVVATFDPRVAVVHAAPGPGAADDRDGVA